MRKTALLLAFALLAATVFAARTGSATITTAQNGDYGWDFSTSSGTNNYTIADVMVEPWDQPGWCGNFYDAGAVAFDSVVTAPSEGYLWDVQGFEDCKYVNSSHIYIFKTREGKYAKVKITDAQHRDTSPGFENTITFTYVYQDDGSTDLAYRGNTGMCLPGFLVAFVAVSALLVSKYA